jgi:hypothetical protein
MTDPKHLPPRDCLVLYYIGENRQAWIQVSYDAGAECSADLWRMTYSGEGLDMSSVIDFREMDVMG